VSGYDSYKLASDEDFADAQSADRCHDARVFLQANLDAAAAASNSFDWGSWSVDQIETDICDDGVTAEIVLTLSDLPCDSEGRELAHFANALKAFASHVESVVAARRRKNTSAERPLKMADSARERKAEHQRRSG